jgi:hypothetical protein
MQRLLLCFVLSWRGNGRDGDSSAFDARARGKRARLATLFSAWRKAK